MLYFLAMSVPTEVEFNPVIASEYWHNKLTRGPLSNKDFLGLYEDTKNFRLLKGLDPNNLGVWRMIPDISSDGFRMGLEANSQTLKGVERIKINYVGGGRYELKWFPPGVAEPKNLGQRSRLVFGREIWNNR